MAKHKKTFFAVVVLLILSLTYILYYHYILGEKVNLQSDYTFVYVYFIRPVFSFCISMVVIFIIDKFVEKKIPITISRICLGVALLFVASYICYIIIGISGHSVPYFLFVVFLKHSISFSIAGILLAVGILNQ
jgi:hypothetical protein